MVLNVRLRRLFIYGELIKVSELENELSESSYVGLPR